MPALQNRLYSPCSPPRGGQTAPAAPATSLFFSSHVQAVFEPMRAANNATALYIGTVRFTHDALWLKKRELEALQEKDAIQRVFLVYPPDVTRANPAYSLFLRGQEAKYGPNHPTIRSEYYLQPLDGTGGLFPPRRLALMRGSHPRLLSPLPTENYIATLDVAGQDEAATDPIAQLTNPGRDYTVATIFRVIPPGRPAPGPTYEAVDVFVDHGSRHFQNSPGQPALVHRLLAWLQHWRVAHVVADATGAGEGLVDWLSATLGQNRITPFKFTALSKAALGSRFLSIVETGRFHYWQDDEELPLSDAWWFFQQVAACTYELLPDAPFDRGLRHLTAVQVTFEGLLDRTRRVIPRVDIRLLGGDLVLVNRADVVRQLAETDTEAWVRRDKLVGREIVTSGQSKVASLADVLLGDEAEVVGFKLGRTHMEGPVAKSGAVSRKTIVDIGSADRPMIVDLEVAEREDFTS